MKRGLPTIAPTINPSAKPFANNVGVSFQSNRINQEICIKHGPTAYLVYATQLLDTPWQDFTEVRVSDYHNHVLGESPSRGPSWASMTWSITCRGPIMPQIPIWGMMGPDRNRRHNGASVCYGWSPIYGFTSRSVASPWRSTHATVIF